jgi:hypothetical protein
MSQLVMVGVRLILVLFVSQTVVLVGAKLVHTGDDRDPFDPYEAIMPGQPEENLADFSCNWRTEYFENGRIGVCRTNAAGEPFPSVIVSVDSGVIQSLMLGVSGLTIGDLARYWGRPLVGNLGNIYSARWYRAGFMVTVPLRRRFSYWLPVRNLYVELHEESGSL